MGIVSVLSPAAASKVSQSAPLPLPADLAGKTIGFLDNTKTNFDQLTRMMERLLRERYDLAGVVHRKKLNAATSASPEILAALEGLDLVVTGSAD